PSMPPPAPAAPARAQVSPPPPPQEDRGALAALRTIRSQKRRAEQLPLAAQAAEGVRARLDLLCALAEKRPPRRAAELLMAAGELAEELADLERARALYTQALERAPSHAGARRALCRLALAIDGAPGFLRALEARAAFTQAPAERARVL